MFSLYTCFIKLFSTLGPVREINEYEEEEVDEEAFEEMVPIFVVFFVFGFA